MYRAVRRVLGRYLGHSDFRIVHISIQHNHLHLLVEAADRHVLTRRMQSFAINAARALNRAHGGRLGKVFAYRYHATQIRTPRQARCALAPRHGDLMRPAASRASPGAGPSSGRRG